MLAFQEIFFAEGSVEIFGNAVVRGVGIAYGNAKIGSYAYFDVGNIGGNATIFREYDALYFPFVQARSEYYGLTIYRTIDGPRADWGCRHGIDLRLWLKQKGYENLKAFPLACLRHFEKLQKKKY